MAPARLGRQERNRRREASSMAAGYADCPGLDTGRLESEIAGNAYESIIEPPR